MTDQLILLNAKSVTIHAVDDHLVLAVTVEEKPVGPVEPAPEPGVWTYWAKSYFSGNYFPEGYFG